MTTPAPLSIDETIQEFLGLLVDVDDAIERWQRPGILRGSQYVIRTSPGLYLRRLDDAKYQPTGVLRASIYSAEIAAVLARDVHDGAGNRGERVHYLDALRAERDELARLIEWMESRRKPYGGGALAHAVDESVEASHVDDVNYVGHPCHY